MKRTIRRPVLAYFLLAFIIPWSGIALVCLPQGFPGQGDVLQALQPTVLGLMLLGPLVASVALTFAENGWSGIKALFAGFARWGVGWRGTLAAMLLIPASALAVLLPLTAVSPDFTPGFLDTGGGLGMLALSLAAGLFVGLVEETGWTGYATPRLLAATGVWATILVLGTLHGVWHLASNFWFEGARFGWVFVPYFLVAWVVAIVVMRALAVRLYTKSKSVLVAAVVHASHTGGLLAIWPVATSPMQDLAWTTAFAIVSLAMVSLSIWRRWI